MLLLTDAVSPAGMTVTRSPAWMFPAWIVPPTKNPAPIPLKTSETHIRNGLSMIGLSGGRNLSVGKITLQLSNR